MKGFCMSENLKCCHISDDTCSPVNERCQTFSDLKAKIEKDLEQGFIDTEHLQEAVDQCCLDSDYRGYQTFKKMVDCANPTSEEDVQIANLITSLKKSLVDSGSNVDFKWYKTIQYDEMNNSSEIKEALDRCKADPDYKLFNTEPNATPVVSTEIKDEQNNDQKDNEVSVNDLQKKGVYLRDLASQCKEHWGQYADERKNDKTNDPSLNTMDESSLQELLAQRKRLKADRKSKISKYVPYKHFVTNKKTDQKSVPIKPIGGWKTPINEINPDDFAQSLHKELSPEEKVKAESGAMLIITLSESEVKELEKINDEFFEGELTAEIMGRILIKRAMKQFVK